MTVATSLSRYFNFRLAIGIPMLVMAGLLIAEPTKLDFTLANFFYLPGQGFIGKQYDWVETLLHDQAKQVVIAFAVLIIIGFVVSLLNNRLKPYRAALGYLVLALSISTSIVPPLKAMTAVHCPWSLSDFGGEETYTPLVHERAPTDKPGRCWPGGHASTGFSLIAVFFALRDRKPRLARAALVFAIGLGTVFSIGRMAQGAHFLSHNVWTFLFDWLICVLCYRGVLYRSRADLNERTPEALKTG
ncbi:phosphatase PAP2 family protein [Pseudomonas sp. TTU2014-080ASC]|uniref:phosphatase PAP2 family protein n=1 Tax=Pseudomonas sp. TTU2014-080ASC TaxID=1729724 RepID=UPI00071844C6|nr:phosphatase PAP2 family protein [Pseudomonas sp. TTU2014-080ASC]KRW58115.1 phosphoesterase [Pseudomonas sp. TTU2014-080ASC]